MFLMGLFLTFTSQPEHYDFLALFSARFSFNVLVGFFLVSFFLSIDFDIGV
jgi:hypothetical protein